MDAAQSNGRNRATRATAVRLRSGRSMPACRHRPGATLREALRKLAEELGVPS